MLLDENDTTELYLMLLLAPAKSFPEGFVFSIHTPGKIAQHKMPVHTVTIGQGCHTKMHR